MFTLLLHTIQLLTTALTVAGMGFFVAALVAARRFLADRRRPLPNFAPGVSLLKSLKGLDPGLLEGFRSHCRQRYTGEYELLFGVSSLDDPAVAAVRQLQREFPERSIRLVECPRELGANGKVSTLIQLMAEARHEFVLINDSDIVVSPRYLERVMACFAVAPGGAGKTAQDRAGNPEAAAEVGLVTALYRGRAHGTLFSEFEALGIATDFQAGVLLSRLIEGGLHYGLGSTLAVRRRALEEIGGLEALADHLADDYELGARIAQAGYRVELAAEVVETNVAAYDWRGFVDHQLRWSRTVRDSRPGGYVGLIFTHGLGWALVNLAVCGGSTVSELLLLGALTLRVAVALVVGGAVLGDRRQMGALWLLPLRDLLALGLWAAGFAGNTIVWRGRRFRLEQGRLRPIG